ncbi:MAG: ATP-binding protein [Desulfobacterales bacterium]|nr:ATP-binding protein [Desulfobacterales bacterium]
MPNGSTTGLKSEAQAYHGATLPAENGPADINHLISALPTILIGLSKDSKIVLWNSQAEIILGKTTSEVMGKPLQRCGIDWDWDKIAGGIRASQSASQPTRVDDIRFQRSDGEERYLGMTINHLAGDSDSKLGSTIIGADITDRKKLETQLQQSQKMEAIGQLAAGIAHEINTPAQFVGDNTRFFQDAYDDLIQIIKDYEKLMEQAKAGTLKTEQIEEVEKRIEDIDLEYLEEEIPIALQHTLKGVDRITKIVQAMKIFSHPGMLVKEPTDINREIEKTITITRNEWKYVARMETDFDPNLPHVPCFRAELNQVILNMIVNAAHAIAEANGDKSPHLGTIRIRTYHKDNWAEIRISDNGAGIPEDIRTKIFDLFFTTKGAGKGSGQGLAISHSVIVEKHKGSLDLESQEGRGTTFIIGLPLGAEPKEDE